MNEMELAAVLGDAEDYREPECGVASRALSFEITRHSIRLAEVRRARRERSMFACAAVVFLVLAAIVGWLILTGQNCELVKRIAMAAGALMVAILLMSPFMAHFIDEGERENEA